MNKYNIYGIPNCGSVKKAVDFFTRHNIPFETVNFKKTPISEDLAKSWLSQKGAQLIINKKGTSWRQLDEETKSKELDYDSALSLIMNNNSIVKRPIITLNGNIVMIGFDDELYNKSFT